MTQIPTLSVRGTLISRMRIPLQALGGVVFIVGTVLANDRIAIPGLVVFLVGLVFYFRFGQVKTAPIPVTPPIRGTWTVVNSPASQVPSHGLHAYAQTYAMDLAPNSKGEANLKLGWKGGIRPPNQYSGFGERIYSPIDGTVVRVRDRSRDHQARDSWPALIYFFAESAVREVTGPSRLLGNHITIATDSGVYAVLAHLKRGSALVKPGDRVKSGQEVGACGNSGNSTQPHLHFQLMDRKSPVIAAGLPFEFEVDSEPVPTPKNGELLEIDSG